MLNETPSTRDPRLKYGRPRLYHRSDGRGRVTADPALPLLTYLDCPFPTCA